MPTRYETEGGVEYLWGRGTVDMKAGCAVHLRLAVELTEPNVDVTWVWYDHEEVSDALADLAGSPGDRSTRQEAADRALEVARQLATGDTPSEPEAVAAIVALRTAATDLMVFAGVEAEQADAAVREGTGEFRVPAPPPSSRAPFGLRRSGR